MQELPLTRGMFTLVDDDDFVRLTYFDWYAHIVDGRAYAIRKNGKNATILLHRELMGVTETNIYVDHIDHDSLNNQKHNLRICTNSQNQMNSVKKCITTSSIYKGVTWLKDEGRWKSQLMLNYKHVHIRRFAREIDAALDYDNAARKYFGEFASINFSENI
jgi:hypothetical protein